MTRLKKITTSVVLLLIQATPLFFSVSVLVKQQIAQSQRDKKFSKEILQTISVSSAEIYWVTPEKEIFFKGKLFDVKSYSKNGNSISLTGFFDNKEDKLVQQIVKLTLQKNQSGSPLSEPAIKFIFFPAYVMQHEINAGLNWKYISQSYHQYDEVIPTPPCSSPLHPPC
ncbi:MAG: hypothetical protein IPO01_02230 [Chitinophagaceae bacterium]|nr:hypothetical protein [Chitinophagaceae bacterium]